MVARAKAVRTERSVMCVALRCIGGAWVATMGCYNVRVTTYQLNRCW